MVFQLVHDILISPPLALSGFLSGALLFAVVLILFAAVLWLIRWLFRIEWSPFSVARAVLDEAIRMRTAVVFIGLLLLVLSSLPFLLDAEMPLKYRVQSLLSYGLGATGFLLSLMTVFLACGTLSFEIEDKRIFTVMVKPIDRGAYLLGKWMGIAALNTILLCVAGTAIFGATRFLARQEAHDANDLGAVQEEILTARVTARPQPNPPLEQRVEKRIEALKREDPEQLEEMGEEEAVKELTKIEARRWRHIPPNGRETYVFHGLNDARGHGEYVQLRYKARPSKIPPSGKLRLAIDVNGHEMVMPAQVRAFQILPVPTKWIDDEGRLALTVTNVDPTRPDRAAKTSVSFLGEDELEVLYQVDSFGMNIVRGMMVLWLKLCFLAVLGLFAGSFLSFPVASLAALVIFITASASGYLLESLQTYSEHDADKQLGWATAVMRWLAMGMARLLGQYSHFSVNEKLTDGRLVPWSMVLSCLGWIGAVWCGVTGLLAWRIFQARELGREQA